MADPTIIEADVIRGKSFLTNLIHNEIYNYEIGLDRDSCIPDSKSLLFIIRALEYRIAEDKFDEVTEALWRCLVSIIGQFAIQVPPTVNAGVNQSASIGDTVIFEATATPGTGTIVSYLWTKISGGSVTMTNTNTSILTVSNFGVGNFTFRVTVTDSNNLTAMDTVNLTASGVLVQIQYDSFTTEPDLSTVVLTRNFTTLSGNTEFNIPYNSSDNNKYIVWSQPISEPDKTNWFNSTLNYGTVPDAAMKAQVTLSDKKVIGSRDIFSFDSANYTLKVSI